MPPNSNEPLALHPTIFVIFGITGDLASGKLLPALLALYALRLPHGWCGNFKRNRRKRGNNGL